MKFKPNTIVKLTKPLVGYKKVGRWEKSNPDLYGHTFNILIKNLIVRLEIPKGAYVRFGEPDYKGCSKNRASEARVLSITYAKYYLLKSKEGLSNHDRSFVYRVGDTVKPRERFCRDARAECASGIHFFLTRKEAKLW